MRESDRELLTAILLCDMQFTDAQELVGEMKRDGLGHMAMFAAINKVEGMRTGRERKTRQRKWRNQWALTGGLTGVAGEAPCCEQRSTFYVSLNNYVKGYKFCI